MSLEHPSWWDAHSDQPYKLAPSDKPRLKAANLNEYLRTAFCTLGSLPAIAWHYARPKRIVPPTPRDFVGLGISPDHGGHQAVSDLVEEVGVQNLLLRVPSWHVDRLDYYLDFANRFKGRKLLINILQSRQSVLNPSEWLETINRVIDAFFPLTTTFQIGNAINRSKWGCHHTGEYLELLKEVDDLRTHRPNLVLGGSSVIDFEPLATIRTLVNGYRYHLDACTCALYVNRRGSPYSHQYRFFDLERKIRLIHAITKASNRCAPRVWVTETNWPLLNTKPYTPNSGLPRSTVDETTQAKYLTDYYRIAYQTGLIERVYWWQLINPGYGLVDHRHGVIRKMPSYNAFANLLAGGLLQD